MEKAERKFADTKLIDLCLYTITENFELFMAARASGQNIPARNFHFLQIAYSKRLFKELAGTKHFVKHMDFILNEHVEEVDLDLCRVSRDEIGQIFERLKVIGPTIIKLTLSKFLFTTDMLFALVLHLPNVEILSMRDTYITDNVLQNIGKYCMRLETLLLRGSYNVKDSGIKLLCSMREDDGFVRKNYNLKHLDLDDTEVSADGITFVLKHFPNMISIQHESVLPALYHIYIDMVENNVPQPFEPYKLNKLIIEYNKRYLDAVFLRTCVLLCPYVTKLTIEPITSQTQLDAIAGLKELREVRFGIDCKSISLTPFIESQGCHLEKLRVSKGSISVESVVQFCPRLKLLDVHDSRFEPVKFKGGAMRHHLLNLNLFSLEELDLGDDIIRKSVNFILASAPNLKVLNFTFTPSLTLDFITSISQHRCMTSIREINLTSSDITSFIVEKLSLLVPNLVCTVTAGLMLVV